MLRIGAKTGDLQGILTMVADYYHTMGVLWTRLKGVIFYPAIVLFLALLLSIFLQFWYEEHPSRL